MNSKTPFKPKLLTITSLLVIFALASGSSSSFAQASGNSSNGNPTITANHVAIGVELDSYNYWKYGVNVKVLKNSYSLGWARAIVAFNPNFRDEYRNLTSAGINILGRLDIWTLVSLGLSGPPPCQANCNWTVADWERVVGWAINNYSKIHVWEIWNEPWVPETNSGPISNTNATGYFQILKGAYQIIKAHNSSDTVLAFGGAPTFVWNFDDPMSFTRDSGTSVPPIIATRFPSILTPDSIT